jgi:hypothetical protein
MTSAGLLMVAGCASHSGHATSTSQRAGLTPAQFTAAVVVARRETRGSARKVNIATATVTPGTITASNTGHRCTSGNLLHLTLLGEFNIVTAAVSGQPVHEVDITADPVTGAECFISVRTASLKPDPDAAVLFTH